MQVLFFRDGLLDGKRGMSWHAWHELIWGANLIPPGGEPEGPRPVAFARAGKLVRTAARFDGALPEAQRDYRARRAAAQFRK